MAAKVCETGQPPSTTPVFPIEGDTLTYDNEVRVRLSTVAHDGHQGQGGLSFKHAHINYEYNKLSEADGNIMGVAYVRSNVQ